MDKFIRAYVKNECLYDFKFGEVNNLINIPHLADGILELPNENAIIYVSSSNLNLLLSKIYYSRKKYVLLVETGDGSLREVDYIPYNVLGIYSSNIEVQHPLYKYFPFGILPGHFNAIRKCVDDSGYRENKVFVAFNTNTYAKRYLYRENIMKLPSDFIVDRNPCNSIEYYEQLLRCKYTAAPRGNGVDTYRKYEALHSYSIPIVQPNLTNLLSPFPCIFTDSEFEISVEDIEKQLSGLHYLDNSMLQCSYWRNKMEKDML